MIEKENQHLILIGGGHSHAIALQYFSLQKPSDLRITLITESVKTPYSGMLPGHIAGVYSYDESHINLSSLARKAGAELLIDEVIGLDLKNNQVICANHSSISFDLLSINIGSRPRITTIIDAEKYAIPVKPVEKFLNHWYELLNSFQKLIKIAIVGGGAGGVELALAMKNRLENRAEITIFHQGSELLSNHSPKVRVLIKKQLEKQGIKVYLNNKINQVYADSVETESGLKFESDRVFLLTEASAQPWVKNSGLTTDEKGFILVKNTLQSLSHAHIFAAGDMATMVNYPRPKSGVFAVRQGKPLFENLQNYLQGKTLKNYIPQRWILNIMGIGGKNAIASWGVFGFQSPLLWQYKDYLDRQFMNRF
jgi:selenide, water dikinase